MLSDNDVLKMEKQQYRIVGDHKHSAVKTCGWTKKMVKGEGGCYKLKFYGIMSHQCMQMTTSMSCANRCTFCWRDYKAPVGKSWHWKMDEPENILEQSLKAHHDLLAGFGGNEKASKALFGQSKTVKHVALSLTGEPIIYPKINELLKLFNEQGISTFLVTNAQFPEEIEAIEDVTQLYLSIDAATKEKLKEIDRPLFKDFWEKMNKSLDILKTRKYRTCIRLTMIKGENTSDFEEYAKLIEKGQPDFIELKSYVWVGASQKSYEVKNMPYMQDMKSFTDEILKFIPYYEYLESHVPSRAVLLGKKSLNKKHWINFPKFFDLVNSGKDYITEDYSEVSIQPNE